MFKRPTGKVKYDGKVVKLPKPPKPMPDMRRITMEDKTENHKTGNK
jgi:hypothetical protein